MTRTGGWSRVDRANTAYHERRRHHRRTVACLLSFDEEAANGRVIRAGVGRMVDVSNSGLCVETDETLEVGRRLRLEIAVDEEIVRATVQVVHVMPLDGGLYAVGATFESVREKDRARLCMAPAPAS